jgi:glycosyltransferase involved in cell wall biosynthesis
MNIAEITTYKEGGAYTHVAELVKKIDANILIITGNTKESGYHKENGQTFFHIPALFSIWTIYFVNPPGSYKKLERLFKKHEIDLVHFHGPLFTFCSGMLRKTKLPLVMTTHYILEFKGNRIASYLYNRFIRWITRGIAERVERIICVNKDYLPVLKGWGIDPKKLVFIPNGVDTERFSPGRSKIKENFKGKKVIVYFGRLHFQKNVHLLIKSMEYIKKEIDNVKLIIIGDGPDYNNLKKMSAKYGDDIIMTGYLRKDEELVDYLRGADIAVFPSRGENASFTIMEAMACELPVISSDVGNAGEILGEGRGIVFKEYNEKELAEKCVYLLKNEKIAREIGKKAREYVKKNHGWEKISKRTEELYKEIIRTKKYKDLKKRG